MHSSSSYHSSSLAACALYSYWKKRFHFILAQTRQALTRWHVTSPLWLISCTCWVRREAWESSGRSRRRPSPACVPATGRSARQQPATACGGHRSRWAPLGPSLQRDEEDTAYFRDGRESSTFKEWSTIRFLQWDSKTEIWSPAFFISDWPMHNCEVVHGEVSKLAMLLRDVIVCWYQ